MTDAAPAVCVAILIPPDFIRTDDALARRSAGAPAADFRIKVDAQRQKREWTRSPAPAPTLMAGSHISLNSRRVAGNDSAPTGIRSERQAATASALARQVLPRRNKRHSPIASRLLIRVIHGRRRRRTVVV